MKLLQVYVFENLKRGDYKPPRSRYHYLRATIREATIREANHLKVFDR